MDHLRRLLAIAVLLLAPPLAALAQSAAPGGPPSGEAGHGPHGPPPEAVAACQGKAVGAQASFTDRAGRTVSGACMRMGDVVAAAGRPRAARRRVAVHALNPRLK